MTQKTSSERLADLMGRLRRERQAELKESSAVRAVDSSSLRPAGTSRPFFSIALSRESGTCGRRVAQAVAERLGWPMYDRELLKLVAEEMNVRTTLLESVDEKRRGVFQECVESLLGGGGVTESAYVHHLLHVLLSLGAHGEAVIVGRGAAQLLPPATTLRVRLVSPLSERIAVVQHKFGVTREEAARRIEKTDAEREAFVKAFFHKDPVDPRGYDVVLCAMRYSAAGCAEIIVESLRRLQAHILERGPAVAEEARA